MLINLALYRKRGLGAPERSTRMASTARAVERQEAEPPAAIPTESTRTGTLLAGFEEMLSAYISLVMRDVRD